MPPALKMTRDLLSALKPQINAALASVSAANPGIVLRIGDGTYDPIAGTAVLKLEVAVRPPEGPNDPLLIQAEADWVRYCAKLGLRLEWFGQEIGMFRVVGLMPSRTSYPVLIEDKQGKRKLLAVETVRMALGGRK